MDMQNENNIIKYILDNSHCHSIIIINVILF